ncbi:hypothetical protein C8N47_1023 [Mangrovibacterium marinum]|uniref:Uncharacterized protein n=2 Tax=Mangrovibacterium marinum TaxID=1639118 RepID=A0A2T5C550_9BACT|nr:hypothetical protein C8N47_1023 [Mangrovibacterium marinum]
MMCRNIEDSCELLDIYSNFLLSSIDYHDKLDFSSQEEADAAMISQMIFTKILHLKSAVSGITYSNNTGVKLNRIIDPTVVVSLVRNIFETVGLFNLMFRATDNRDFRYIIYLLWVLSGLKYRQRFEQQAIMEENLNKIAQEKQDIDNIIDEIRNSKIYLEQGDSEKSVIEQAIKEKKYLLHFNGDKIEILHWQRLTETMEIKEGLFDNFYSYFSLYAHPTNVSVFQYADMFKREEMTFLDLTNFNTSVPLKLGRY